MTEETVVSDLMTALPEIVLAVGAMALLMLGVFRARPVAAAASGRPGRRRDPGLSPGVRAGSLVLVLSVVLLIGAAVLVGLADGTATAFGGLFVDDPFARFAKILILGVSALMLVLGADYLRRNEMMQFEYPILIVFACLGMCMMVSAQDLMTVYMGIELQSLSLYVVASFQRDSVRSTEAGLKYFVLGAIGSGLLLYGASLTYGFAGSTNFDAIAAALAAEDEASLGVLFGLAFILAGLAFKLSAAPFHMWTPDVYEGAPAPVTAYFASAPKLAAAALFARMMSEPFGALIDDWRQIIAFIALASMFLGAFAGIGQTNLKRLLAYSSIGHMGFALVALAAGERNGVEAMLLYMTIYLVMTVGVFAFLLTMTRSGVQTTRIADLDGLASTHPGAAACLALLMFSLAGVPPLWGFFAKYKAFLAAVENGLTWLAVAGVVASVISAFYYLNIVRRMYFSEPDEPLELKSGVSHTATLGVAAVAMLIAVAPVVNGLGAREAAARAAAAVLPDPVEEAGAPAGPIAE